MREMNICFFQLTFYFCFIKHSELCYLPIQASAVLIFESHCPTMFRCILVLLHLTPQQSKVIQSVCVLWHLSIELGIGIIQGCVLSSQIFSCWAKTEVLLSINPLIMFENVASSSSTTTMTVKQLAQQEWNCLPVKVVVGYCFLKLEIVLVNLDHLCS